VDNAAELAPFVPRLLLSRREDAPRRWQIEGTMVLVDISGFTSLSEQLAARGRAGTEDLVQTLTRIFTLLLSATDDGGDVVKFAGDALLVLYEGAEHERRACHAAHAMQRMLGLVGNLRLGGARARLRMSVGVHTGHFDMLLTGGTHQNLVVAGPEMTELMRLQDAAVAGETLVSPATAVALAAGALAGGHDGGRMLRRAPHVEQTGGLTRAPRVRPDKIRRYLPEAFAQRPDLLLGDSEHRSAAIAFVQVSDLNRRLGGDVLGVVDRLTAVVERACREHGVTLLDADMAKDGFRYFMTAGAPIAEEDPEGRLGRALVEIVSAGDELPVRAGLTSGRVFGGAVGPGFRRTYTVMGDTTNLAARLTAKAQQGTVLAQRRVLERARTHFATAHVDAVAVKGKREPIPVVRIDAATGRRPSTLSDVGFVGREYELTAIAAEFASVRAGAGAAVELVGEAGAGKSRLAREALSRLGLPVLAVYGDPVGASIPYQALRMLLRPLLGIPLDTGSGAAGAELTARVVDELPQLGDWLPLLAPMAGADVAPTKAVAGLDERFRVARAQAALAELLAELVAEPTALMLDDAQWLDQSSADALRACFAELHRRPWAVLATRRSDAPGAALFGPAIAVASFGADAARRLVAEGAGRPLRPAQIEAIVRRGDGNAHFLLELAAGGAVGELPDSVEEVVAGRMDALDAFDRDVLRQAAVLGTRFHRELYAEATGDRALANGQPPPGLDAFVALHGDGTLTFRREVYRDVAYGQLSFRRRRELHRRALQAIESRAELVDAPLAAMALHAFEAGLWEPAYRHSRRAGEHAAAANATEEAVGFCRQALRAAARCDAPVEEISAVQELLADSARLAGHVDDCLSGYRSAARNADPASAARIAGKMAQALREHGRYDAALRAIGRARRQLAMAAEPHLTLAVNLDIGEAGIRHLQGRSAQARRLAEAVLLLTNEGDPADDELAAVRAHAMFLWDLVTVDLDGPAAARYRDAPLKTFMRLGDAYHESAVANNLGVISYWSGEWAAAVEHYLRAESASNRAGDVAGAAFELANVGEILVLQRRVLDAIEVLSRALRTFEATGHAFGVAFCHGQLGACQLARGDFEEAERLLGASIAGFRAIGMESQALDVRTRIVELHLARGAAAAGEEVDSIVADVSRDGSAAVLGPRALRLQATAFAARGLAGEAEASLRRSVEDARSLGLDYERALSLRALGELSGDAGAREQASAVLRRLGVSGA
jgi:class 3 adenylate cyclase/tetratricopeptide (TPR) repeat protein